MHIMKYELYLKKWRNSVNLSRYARVIRRAIKEYIPKASNIIVANKFYSYESHAKPMRGQLINIGRYISRHSKLKAYVKQYASTGNKWKPSRKLFKRVKK